MEEVMKQGSGAAHNVRVVVADEESATFFDLPHARARPRDRVVLLNDAGGLHDRDLESDRPGRGAGHEGGGRHAYDGERSTERHQTAQFAKRIARAVDDGRARNEFARLVIIAGPRMLGLIRSALPDNCRHVVAAEISRDLAHSDTARARDAVPREAFLH
jgi:protein required for attachment to host cells